tara:strand:+ start:310 stop:516 length:207 start_codon:yes stop_codon:yes gene_type:complete
MLLSLKTSIPNDWDTSRMSKLFPIQAQQSTQLFLRDHLPPQDSDVTTMEVAVTRALMALEELNNQIAL